MIGGISGVLTLPLDVIKTRKQVLGSQLTNVSTWRMINQISQQEGLAALFLGIRARTAKTVIHCSLVLTMYEMCLQALDQFKPNNYLF